ncbi:hypothetical protein [Phormidium sp. CCY1219]|uniref:hypothetical protein n=1 Tax=Phormidium sp. CCY1219 TaxID=2886104 RepID=UPI002D1EAEC0|nr:hypothetical protein [Phormidium sp. CCY1219]MEB3828494.1 hypothetical protein [Phormidium sp. CCY1219]
MPYRLCFTRDVILLTLCPRDRLCARACCKFLISRYSGKRLGNMPGLFCCYVISGGIPEYYQRHATQNRQIVQA